LSCMCRRVRHGQVDPQPECAARQCGAHSSALCCVLCMWCLLLPAAPSSAGCASQVLAAARGRCAISLSQYCTERTAHGRAALSLTALTLSLSLLLPPPAGAHVLHSYGICAFGLLPPATVAPILSKACTYCPRRWQINPSGGSRHALAAPWPLRHTKRPLPKKPHHGRNPACKHLLRMACHASWKGAGGSPGLCAAAGGRGPRWAAPTACRVAGTHIYCYTACNRSSAHPQSRHKPGSGCPRYRAASKQTMEPSTARAMPPIPIH
jgi:hypothetical protein